MTINRNIQILLYLILAADAGFIMLHLALAWGWIPLSLLPNPGPAQREVLLSMLQLDRDRSYAEVFQYVKEGWIVLLLGLMMFRRSFTLHAGWALLFLFFLLDDALGLHEHVGLAIAQGWSLPAVAGLRAQDLGELTFVAAVGAVIFALIVAGYWLSTTEDRRFSLQLAGAVVLLVVCGVGADMAHVALPGGLFWIIVEDGGEMVAISLALVAALSSVLAFQPTDALQPATGWSSSRIGKPATSGARH